MNYIDKFRHEKYLKRGFVSLWVYTVHFKWKTGSQATDEIQLVACQGQTDDYSAWDKLLWK